MEDKFKKTITTEKPKCILAAASDGNAEGPGSEFSMNELERLLDTAGGVAEARLVQMRDKPDNATYLGEGKIEELRELASSVGAELVVFDDELTPSQIRNIEERLENVRVIDRTMLILDIFAGRAATAEGILQVEIARLKYTMPRLLGKGTGLSRLGGGIGTRGPVNQSLKATDVI